MFRARHRRNIGLHRESLGGGLITEFRKQFRRRPDELDPRLHAGAGEVRILRQKSISRMDRIDPMLLGDDDERRNIQVSLDRQSPFSRADQIRLVSLKAVKGKTIFVGINRDRTQSQFSRRPKNADGDLTPIGDKQLPHQFPVSSKERSTAKNPRYCGGERGICK